MTHKIDRDVPIAVVGASALFPGSVGSGSFWNNILAGRDFMGDVPPANWLIEDYFDPKPGTPNKTYARRGAFLPPVPFDPLEHGLPPRQLSTTDTAQLLALIVAQQVLDDAASVQFGRVDRQAISVILGVASATELLGDMAGRIQRPNWVKALREAGLPESQVQDICQRIEATYPEWDESTFPGLLGNVVAGRIANRLNLGGTNCVVDAACASSLGAVAMAVQELQTGHSDLVITGGVDTLNNIFMYMCFTRTPAMSLTGDCRPFAEAADGTMLGEGLGMLALRRLEDAERDGDRIYAVLRGIGSSSDGRAKSIYAPVARGQSQALRRAYERAGYSPADVGLVEAHGTATKAGDVAEFEGLREAFTVPDAPKKPWVALGSVKSQIGHTKAAAGAASLFKVVMALHHKVLPPTIKVDQPNSKLDIGNSPFYLNTEARPWVQAPGRPRRASVSSFGFGGSNFHVTLEEYAGPGPQAWRLSALPAQLLVVGADSAQATIAAAERLSAQVAAEGLASAARASQQGFAATSVCRLALVAADAEAAQASLAQAIQQLRTQGEVPFSLPSGVQFGVGREVPQVAFLFPGQGSQQVNMGRHMAMAFDAVRGVWDEAAALPFDAEWRLDEVVYPTPVFNDPDRQAQARRLTQTEWAQPAIGACSLGLLRWLQALGVQPQATAGHSYGELVALHAAGALPTAAQLLGLSRLRGELMRDAARVPGAMVAVMAPQDQLAPLLVQVPEVVVANHNSPKQRVVAGPTEAIERFEQLARAAGVAFTRLSVATAFHTELVAPSAQPFEAALRQVAWQVPRVPVYGNTLAQPYAHEPAAMAHTLATQLARPVQFMQMVQRMHDDGIRLFIEVGPGSVLTSMTGDVLAGRPHVAVALDSKRGDGCVAALHALAVLTAQGLTLNFEALWSGHAPWQPAVAPPKRSAATVMLSGTNHGRPYPPPGGAAARPAPNPEIPVRTPVASVAETPTPAAPVAPVTPVTPVAHGAAPLAAMPPVIPVAQVVAQPAVSAVPASTGASPQAWSAFEAMQRQVFDAHAAFTRALSDSHHAFLRASETAFQQLGALGALGGAAGMAPGVAQPPVASAVAAPAAVVPVQPLQPLQPVVSVAAAAPVPTLAAAPVALVAPVAPASAPVVPAGPDAHALLMQVVADKTGYPVEMLSPEMELEAGLGIDSIKRVEILSALQDKLPQLAQVDTGRLAALATLGEIIDFARSTGAVAGVSNSSAPATPSSVAPVAATSPAAAVDVQALLMQVVADKTGYPVEMLSPEMELEAGLGIDSIKRVEILSALQEQLPELAQVDTGRLAALATLGEIIAFAQAEGAQPNAATAQPMATPLASVPTAAAKPVDVLALLMQVVADKTGYPVEMLSPEMELEAGLGIDSIKRVEILSALQEQLPELAQVDTGRLAALSTLGEIVAFAQGQSAPSSVSADVSGAPGQAPNLGQAPHAVAALRRAEVVLQPAPAPGHVTPGLLPDRVLHIVGGPLALAQAVAHRLNGAGYAVSVVAHAPADADAVVLLTGLGTTGGAESLQADAQSALNEAVFDEVRRVAAHMATPPEVPSAPPRLLVTVQDTGGDFGLSGQAGERAWSAGIGALAKTAALEWPHACVRAIDLATSGRDATALAQALCRELLTGGADLEVGLPANGPRVTPTLVDDRHAPVAAPWDPAGVLLVSGGARGVTPVCLAALLARQPMRVALIGRTVLATEPADLVHAHTDADIKRALLQRHQAAGRQVAPTALAAEARQVLAQRELHTQLQALRDTGAQVMYVAADVGDAAQVQAVVAQVRQQLGPIRGLVHAAGVLADRALQHKTAEQVRQVMRTKVDGLRHLLAATATDALSHIVCFSSVAARLGNVGQADYAMANEVLNRVCRAEAARRGPACLVKAMGWGPWAGGMVDAGLAQHFAARGVALIDLDAGAACFAQAFLGEQGAAVEIVCGAALPDPRPAQPEPQGVALLHHDAATQPWLADHAPRGTPVVPLVSALYSSMRALDRPGPGGRISRARQVKVHGGIPLPQFGIGAQLSRLDWYRQPQGSGWHVRIAGPEQRLQYSLDIAPGHEAPAWPAAPQGLAPWPEATAQAYDGRLFHGPHLQVIEALLGMGDRACSARLRLPPAQAGSTPGPVALLDGGLQLLVRWGHDRLGQAALPTGVDDVWLSPALDTATAALCSGQCRTLTSLQSTWDVVWTTLEGEPLAAMWGVTLHCLPDGAPSETAGQVAHAA
ncbi:MAG: hypothetical protein RI907_384 [Pseudomonadota bacterium]